MQKVTACMEHVMSEEGKRDVRRKNSEAEREAGLSQESFAEQLGVSRQAVSKWETDRGYPETEK